MLPSSYINQELRSDHAGEVGAVEKEIAQIAEYEDKLAVLQKHFGFEE